MLGRRPCWFPLLNRRAKLIVRCLQAYYVPFTTLPRPLADKVTIEIGHLYGHACNLSHTFLIFTERKTLYS